MTTRSTNAASRDTIDALPSLAHIPTLVTLPADSPAPASEKAASLSRASSVDDKEKQLSRVSASSSGEVDALPEGINPDGSYNPAITGHPWRIKGPAIFCVLFLTLGSNFASSSLSPLKSTLKKQLGINNAQYASLDTADSLINTIFPILSGALIDYFGPIRLAIWSSSVILLGAILSGVAAHANNYGLFLFGQIVFGFGSTTIETAQSKLYAFYSLGSAMSGFVFGLDIAVGRVWNLMGKLTSVPIMEGTETWTWTIWVSAIMCAFSLVVTLAIALYERTFPACARVPAGRDALIAARGHGEQVSGYGQQWKQDRRFFLNSIMAIPACFWIIDISQLFQAGAVSTYTSNLADAISVTRGATLYTAGWNASVAQVIPIVLTPCLGMVFDRYGKRMHWVTWTASLYVVVFLLLAYTTVHPLVPSILGSFALATNVLPWIASIPLLVPDQAHLGTAYGIYKALNNCGSVVVNVASGSIQDRATPGKSEYNNVFAFLIVIKGLDVIYGLLYHASDLRYLGGILNASDASLRRMEAKQTPEERAQGLRKPIREVTYVSLATVGAMIVVAWVLYLYYSV
ncbi:hypothetical protein JCM10450v2_004169 [Rhodotorula kratochvilovae]